MQRRKATLIKNDDTELWKVPKAYGVGTLPKMVGGAMLDNNHMLDMESGKITTIKKTKLRPIKKIQRRSRKISRKR